MWIAAELTVDRMRPRCPNIYHVERNVELNPTSQSITICYLLPALMEQTKSRRMEQKPRWLRFLWWLTHTRDVSLYSRCTANVLDNSTKQTPSCSLSYPLSNVSNFTCQSRLLLVDVAYLSVVYFSDLLVRRSPARLWGPCLLPSTTNSCRSTWETGHSAWYVKSIKWV